MVIIQQQGGFRTSYDPETGKLVRIELWERPEKRHQYSLETWPDAESAEKAFWARVSNGRNDAATSAEGLFQVEPAK